MSKRVKFLNPDAQSSSSEAMKELNWEECIFCQEKTSESLQCPANIRRSDIEVGVGYRTLESMLNRCQSINWFPTQIMFNQFIHEKGIAFKLQQMEAKWHKTCRNKYTEMKIERHENIKRKLESGSEETSGKITRQSIGCSTVTMTHDCFFCGESSGELHKVATFGIDSNVRKYALEVQDTVLLAKLSAGDMISQEAMYHKRCYSNLFNKARPQKICDAKEDNQFHGIVLAELVAYIEDSRMDTEVATIFRLADLLNMYTNRLEQFGIDTSKKLNSTHLKDRILAAIPDLEAHKQGRDVLLIFNEDIGKAIKQALASNYDDDAIILSKAAKIVRKDMMETNTSFRGFFETDCQKKSVPQSLKTLIGMILGGPNIETQSGNFIEAQCTLTIAQLLQFNFSVRRRKESSMQSSHSTDREPPLPTYLGLLIHAETRKRGLVDKLYDLGLSISYDRIMQLSTALGNSICESFNTENVVCPAKLRNGIFTSAAIDNIDHNPSSTTAQGSLHGTAISIFQHPVKEGDGFERLISPIGLSAARYEHLKPLPESYTVVPPVVLPKEKSEIPLLNGSLVADGTSISTALNLEYRYFFICTFRDKTYIPVYYHLVDTTPGGLPLECMICSRNTIITCWF